MGRKFPEEIEIAEDGTLLGAVHRLDFVGTAVTASLRTDNVGEISIAGGGGAAGSNTLGMSNLGNTSGTTGVVSGSAVRYLFAGGDNITLSQSLNGVSATLTISAAAGAATNVFTGGMSNLGNTSGTTGVADRRLIIAGGNNITISQSLDAANSSGTITISAFNSASVVSAAGVSTVGNTSGDTGLRSGTLVFQGGNNITLSQVTGAGNSATIVISAPNTVNQYSAGISTLGNTSGTTGLATERLVLAGGNNITLSGSTDGGSMTVTVSAFNQSAESQSVGMSNLGNTSGTTGIASGAQVRYLLAGGNNITLSQSLNGASGTVTISAFNQSIESQSIGMSNLGNTSGTTGIASGGQVQFVFAGGANITLSQSLNGASGTITVSGGAGAGNFSGGLSNIGNTSGDTGVVTGRLVLAGGNNITLSGSTNAGSMTVTVSAAAGGAAPTLSMWQNMRASSIFDASSHGSISVVPLALDGLFPGNMTVSTALLWMSINHNVSTASTDPKTYAAWLGIYTVSGSSTLNMLYQASTTFGTGASNNSQSSILHGVRALSFHSSIFSDSATVATTPSFSQTLYYVATLLTSAGQSIGLSHYNMPIYATGARFGTVGAARADNNTLAIWPFWGRYSATSSVLPATIHLSELTKSFGAENRMPLVQFHNVVSAF